MTCMAVALKFITPNAEQQIGEYAAICYDSDVSADACVEGLRAVPIKDTWLLYVSLMQCFILLTFLGLVLTSSLGASI